MRGPARRIPSKKIFLIAINPPKRRRVSGVAHEAAEVAKTVIPQFDPIDVVFSEVRGIQEFTMAMRVRRQVVLAHRADTLFLFVPTGRAVGVFYPLAQIEFAFDEFIFPQKIFRAQPVELAPVKGIGFGETTGTETSGVEHEPITVER
jgi:hypothetical protein